MTHLSCADVEGALAFVAEAGEFDGAEPFPRRALDLLGRLIPSDGVGYQEYEHKQKHPSFVVEDPEMPLTESAWELLGSRAPDNPLRDELRSRERRALRLSDFLSVRAVRRNPFWAEILRLPEPYGGPYHLRIWLDAPEGQTRQLYFVRRSRDFAERERALLELLRPYLMRLRMNLEVRRLASLRAREGLGLTPRELEVLAWVAGGKANAEIATLLYVAEGTVRKHMDNILTKLGVHTRTAAVHRAFLARPEPS